MPGRVNVIGWVIPRIGIQVLSPGLVHITEVGIATNEPTRFGVIVPGIHIMQAAFFIEDRPGVGSFIEEVFFPAFPGFDLVTEFIVDVARAKCPVRP